MVAPVHNGWLPRQDRSDAGVCRELFTPAGSAAACRGCSERRSRRRQCPALALLPVLLALMWLWAAGCADGSDAMARYPHYVRALHLLKNGTPEQAATAFERCLQERPQLAAAHLQLGILYEDALADPVKAIYHYRAFLEQQPESADEEIVKTWLARAEQANWQHLRSRFEPPPVVAGAVETTEAGELTTRERALAARVKELNSEVLHITAELDTFRVQRAGQAAVAPAAGDNPPDAAPRFHVVCQGDTLSALSRRFYGQVGYWRDLRDANRDVLLKGETLIPGMRLRIPPIDDFQGESEP